MPHETEPIPLLPLPRKLTRAPGSSTAPVDERLDPRAVPPQGYRLSITPNSCRIIAHDPVAVFYARQTLSQLRSLYPTAIPCLEIEDSPDFPIRGVMLDISRDKVPTMSTLFSLIDLLSSWKINQLQLYIEHTFAYRDHEEVWQNASPLTADEIRALDDYCKSRFIDFVPNQNSFGHMERWLRHPRYLPLAEAPDGAETPWGFRWKGPFSLCPTDPRSLDLLSDLYAQLLPNFSSPLFNVGCDETFDIGQGRSRAQCDRVGVHQVYLDFLNSVHRLVQSHSRQMMFWGDIIIKEPSLLPQLPKGAIPLLWGYEADHPFDEQCRVLAQTGKEFYVCPGTSSWCSIVGRTDNMLANQISAATAGLAHGAKGFLNTDWGDYGHLQYLPFSYPGFAAGAALSWCLDSNRNLPLARLLDLYVFKDSAAVTGQAALDLGNVFKSVGKLIPNRSALFSILVPSSTHKDPMEGITPGNLQTARAAIQSAMRGFSKANLQAPDAASIKDEFANAAAMLEYACDHSAGDPEEMIESHRRCWLARNRSGGLEDSISKLAIGNRQS
jgi:hexosaminidase